MLLLVRWRVMRMCKRMGHLRRRKKEGESTEIHLKIVKLNLLNSTARIKKKLENNDELTIYCPSSVIHEIQKRRYSRRVSKIWHPKTITITMAIKIHWVSNRGILACAASSSTTPWKEKGGGGDSSSPTYDRIYIERERAIFSFINMRKDCANKQREKRTRERERI